MNICFSFHSQASDSLTSSLRRGRSDRRLAPWFESLECRRVLSSLTMTSPTQGGPLPTDVTPVGGVVLDLVGINGLRIVTQVPASQLFRGFFDRGEPAAFQGHPGTIGIQTGLTPAIVNALGGGLAEVAVRLTVFDGDTGPGEFDRFQNRLLLNGVLVGDFSEVHTWETVADGLTILSDNPQGGFRDGRLDTGFFHLTGADRLAALHRSLLDTGAVRFQLADDDPFDNLFDFTQGVDAGLIDVGRLPSLPPTLEGWEWLGADGTPLETVPEGTPVRLRPLVRDPDTPRDQLRFDFDPNGDGVFDLIGVLDSVVVRFPNDGPRRVGVRVVDPEGNAATLSAVVPVVNVPPRLVPAPPATIQADEGQPIRLDLGELVDPGDEERWTLEIDWGDGSFPLTQIIDQTGPLGMVVHHYERRGDYVITLRLDDGTDAAVILTHATVKNVPPQFSLGPAIDPDAPIPTLPPLIVEEGTPVTLPLLRFDDPGEDQSWTLTVDWGDGTPPLNLWLDAPGALPLATHEYARGAWVATLTLSDGMDQTVVRVPVTARNLPPVWRPPLFDFMDDQGGQDGTVEPPSLAEGRTIRLPLGRFEDHGRDQTWTVGVFDLGSGKPSSPVQVREFDQPGDLGTLDLTLEQDGERVVLVRIDDGEAIVEGQVVLRVENVKPQVELSLDHVVNPNAGGGDTILTLTVGDPGRRDVLRVRIVWSDGVVEEFELTDGGGAIETRRDDLQTRADEAGEALEVEALVEVDDGSGPVVAAAMITIEPRPIEPSPPPENTEVEPPLPISPLTVPQAEEEEQDRETNASEPERSIAADAQVAQAMRAAFNELKLPTFDPTPAPLVSAPSAPMVTAPPAQANAPGTVEPPTPPTHDDAAPPPPPTRTGISAGVVARTTIVVLTVLNFNRPAAVRSWATGGRRSW